MEAVRAPLRAAGRVALAAMFISGGADALLDPGPRTAKAEELGARSLALVAFGTGVGGFPIDEAAQIMVAAAREHDGALERIVFAVHGEDTERAFRAAL